MVTLIAVSDATISEAESRLLGCEHCAHEAENPFDWFLVDVNGLNGSAVDYILLRTLTSPRCLGEVTDKTSVDW